MPVDSKEIAREIGSTRRWLVLTGIVMAVEGFSLGVLVGFSQPGIEGDEATILTMVIAGVILLCGVVIALIEFSTVRRSPLGSALFSLPRCRCWEYWLPSPRPTRWGAFCF